MLFGSYHICCQIIVAAGRQGLAVRPRQELSVLTNVAVNAVCQFAAALTLDTGLGDVDFVQQFIEECDQGFAGSLAKSCSLGFVATGSISRGVCVISVRQIVRHITQAVIGVTHNNRHAIGRINQIIPVVICGIVKGHR